MKVHTLRAAPPSELAGSLARFEAQFTYPLGSERRFRISHGDDYTRFFRSMGEAACFVVTRQEEVVATLEAAFGQLLTPDGSARTAVYLGDLKISPEARGGRSLVRMAGAVREWVGTRAEVAYGVVMDGTAATPERYTGRLGIPAFQAVGKTAVLRLSTAGIQAGTPRAVAATAEAGSARFRLLSAGRYACLGGIASERSETPPLWLVSADDLACGRLEDTRRAKRLIGDDGVEMHVAHLSCFAYRDLRSGLELLRDALRIAAERGFPALFVAVSAHDAEQIRRSFEGTEVIVAPATVFGAGLERGYPWNINTAEI